MIKAYDENKTNCCGCSACSALCPTNSITMKYDQEGFIYPEANLETCVKCDTCEKVCPTINVKSEKLFNQHCYVVQHKDNNILKESTSGGAFSAIAEFVIDQSGYVFGATLLEDFTVSHVCVDNKAELEIFRNSKYVQSNIDRKIYIKVKNLLDDGSYICFSGTGCQIEALNSFLGKNYERLIMVDVVCRAVPSPLIFKKYIEYQEYNYKGSIQRIRFRDKYFSYKFSTMSLTFRGKKRVYHRGIESDPWLRAFFSNICNRPSCYNCCFKKLHRVSDYTIWDCFQSNEYTKIIKDNAGATNVLIHSEKGIKMFENIKNSFKYIEVDPGKQVENMKEMTSSVQMNVKRNVFFEDAIKLGGRDLFEKYFPITFGYKFKHLSRYISYKLGIHSIVKKIFYNSKRN